MKNNRRLRGSSDAASCGGCGCYVAIIIFNLLLGSLSVNYCLESFLHKTQTILCSVFFFFNLSGCKVSRPDDAYLQFPLFPPAPITFPPAPIIQYSVLITYNLLGFLVIPVVVFIYLSTHFFTHLTDV